MAHTVLRNVKPDSLIVESILVSVEAFKGVVICCVVAIHGGIVLVAENQPRTWDAFAGCFAALAADGFLLIALELPLAARQAGTKRCQKMSNGRRGQLAILFVSAS